MKKEVVNSVAVILYVNEEGIVQTEMRSYPQDHEDEKLRGMPVDDVEYMREIALQFRKDNPTFKEVRVRQTVTTDYLL